MVLSLVRSHCSSDLFIYNTASFILYGQPYRFFVFPNYNKSFFPDSSQIGSILAIYKNISFANSGYYSVLHVKGIGFKVFYFRSAHALYFSLGYNHIIKFRLHENVRVKVRKQYILLFSFEKSILSQTLYQIRRLRYPDVYRGKGIRYRFQIINFKPGKQR